MRNTKWDLLKDYIIGLEKYYDKGACCSMAESKWGSSVVEDILKKMHKIESDYLTLCRYDIHHFADMRNGGSSAPTECITLYAATLDDALTEVKEFATFYPIDEGYAFYVFEGDPIYQKLLKGSFRYDKDKKQFITVN